MKLWVGLKLKTQIDRKDVGVNLVELSGHSPQPHCGIVTDGIVECTSFIGQKIVGKIKGKTSIVIAEPQTAQHAVVGRQGRVYGGIGHRGLVPENPGSEIPVRGHGQAGAEAERSDIVPVFWFIDARSKEEQRITKVCRQLVIGRPPGPLAVELDGDGARGPGQA